MSSLDAVPTPPSGRKPRLPYVFACVIGLALAAGFAFSAWMLASDQLHMAAIGKITEGTITGYKEVRNTGRRGSYLSTTYHPTFRYRTEDGKTVEGTVLDSLERDEIKVGQVMRVMYDPAHPTDVRLASAVEAGLGTNIWMLGGAALLMGVGSVIVLLRLRKT
jgi:hypothetical protein